jgi:hypothetical protein
LPWSTRLALVRVPPAAKAHPAMMIIDSKWQSQDRLGPAEAGQERLPARLRVDLDRLPASARAVLADAPSISLSDLLLVRAPESVTSMCAEPMTAMDGAAADLARMLQRASEIGDWRGVALVVAVELAQPVRDRSAAAGARGRPRNSPAELVPAQTQRLLAARTSRIAALLRVVHETSSIRVAAVVLVPSAKAGGNTRAASLKPSLVASVSSIPVFLAKSAQSMRSDSMRSAGAGSRLCPPNPHTRCRSPRGADALDALLRAAGEGSSIVALSSRMRAEAGADVQDHGVLGPSSTPPRWATDLCPSDWTVSTELVGARSAVGEFRMVVAAPHWSADCVTQADLVALSPLATVIPAANAWSVSAAAVDSAPLIRLLNPQ